MVAKFQDTCNKVSSPSILARLGLSNQWWLNSRTLTTRSILVCVPTLYDAKQSTAIFRLVVQKLRRETAHAHTFDGDFELKIMRMRGFSSQFLDNQPKNRCKYVVISCHKEVLVQHHWCPVVVLWPHHGTKIILITP